MESIVEPEPSRVSDEVPVPVEVSDIKDMIDAEDRLGELKLLKEEQVDPEPSKVSDEGPVEVSDIKDMIDTEDRLGELKLLEEQSFKLPIPKDRILSSGHSVEHHLNEDGDSEKLCPLIPSTLVGYKKPNTTPPASLEEVAMTLNAEGSPLHWQPLHCRPRHLVAILVPLRNRTAHLLTFLRHMHPFLQRQQIAYRVFVIEQSDEGKFNRAKLLNVGFVEAMAALSTTERKLDCVVFHDVDHLPEDDRNLYVCPQSPDALQLAVSVDTDNYTVTYTNFFGAVSAMSAVTFEAVNGYSNMYWGWGGEDDDMAERLQSIGVRIVRSADVVGRYTTLAHHPQIRSLARWEILDRALRRKDFDGLGSLHYTRLALKQTSLMTHILVDLVSTN